MKVRAVTEVAETQSPPLTGAQFENTPEFRRFKTGMKELLKVSKAELDRRIEQAKQNSPRIGKLNAPGRKRKTSGMHNPGHDERL